MSNIQRTLERHFDTFINQNDDWLFFLGLAEYINFIATRKDFGQIIKIIKQEKSTSISDVEKLEQSVISECVEAMEKLVLIIEANRWEYEPLKNELNEFVSYSVGTTQSTAPLSQNLFYCISDIISLLVKKGHCNEVTDFYEMYNNDPNQIKKYTFSPSFINLEKARSRYKEKEEREIWGAFEKLLLCRTIVLYGTDEYDKMRKAEQLPIQIFSLSMLITEIKQIKEGKPKSSNFFKKTDYIFHATRVQNFIISELEAPSSESTQVDCVLEYKNGWLNLTTGEKVLISKTMSGKQHDLLSLLMENHQKEWSPDELWEGITGSEYDDHHKQWKILSNRVNAINTKISQNSSEKQFLICGKKNIFINKTSLKKS